ncbi:MAG: c-type cytochrome, partial [Anaerolineae bacterium]|nr:c-type cytochrome [Anaerolineae bacterium]
MKIRQHLRQWMVLSIVMIFLAGCAGLAGEPAIVVTFPPQPTAAPQTIRLPQTAPDVALGAQLYAENCTRCHGLTGQGDGEMVQSGQVTDVPDFTTPQTAQDASPVAWFEIVTNGRLEKLMPPWNEKLSEAQRWAVTMYVYTLANPPDQIARGQAIWTDSCAECHGPAGEGTDKGAPLPSLLDNSNGELLRVIMGGIPDKMPAFADELSDEERAAVLAYARTLELVNAGGLPHEVASAPTTAAATTPQPVSTEESGAPNATPQPATTEQVGSATGVVSGMVTNQSAGGSVPA